MPSKIPETTRRRCEVVEGSHADDALKERAFEGACAVFWLVNVDIKDPSAEVAYVDFSRPGVPAMKRHGVRYVAGPSALGRGWPRDAGHVTATLKFDDFVATTGAAYRALACPSLMENVLRQVDAIRTGALYGTEPGDHRVSTCHDPRRRDVRGEPRAGSLLVGVDTVPMLDLEDPTPNEMSAVLGRTVSYRTMPVANLGATMRQGGSSDGIADAYGAMMTAKNEGIDHLVRHTPEDARRTLTTFRPWCGDVLALAVGTG